MNCTWFLLLFPLQCVEMDLVLFLETNSTFVTPYRRSPAISCVVLSKMQNFENSKDKKKVDENEVQTTNIYIYKKMLKANEIEM